MLNNLIYRGRDVSYVEEFSERAVTTHASLEKKNGFF